MLSPRKPIFASFRRIMVWCHYTEGYASLHPRLRATRSARAFDLSGRAVGGFTTDFHGIRHGFTQIFFVGVGCLRGDYQPLRGCAAFFSGIAAVIGITWR